VRLLLARHGQTDWNASRRFQGSTDIGLSARGRAQAHALGRALAGRRLAAVYVSPLQRAVDTATLALAGHPVPPVRVLPGLRELSLGEWEGRTVDEIRSQDGDPYLAWLRAPHDRLPPGGEPLDQVAARVRHALEGIAASHAADEEVLVIAHGGVISVYACELLGSSFNSLWRLRVDNCSLTVVKPPRLVSVNDTSHLAAELTGQHLTRA
jgi:broad specificity phosphatase PhoE